MPHQKYIPALSLKWLTPFYDALVEGPMSQLRMRKDLVAQMGDLSGKRILDVGCGTGTMAILIKQMYPTANITGLDGDPQILEIARSKAKKLGFEILFEPGLSFELPYPEASFDIVLTTFMLHHLSRADKQKTAAEMYRVLRPGGQLFGVDFTQPQTRVGNAIKRLVQRFERVADNFEGFLPLTFGEAGFKSYFETHHYLFGTISLFQSPKG